MTVKWGHKLPRLKCKKCGAVFEQGLGFAVLSVHVGPYHRLSCPACGKSSWFNVYTSVKDPVTYPSSEKKPDHLIESELSEEELEKKRIEESKYEKA
jgi:RNase P subunit RPR2